MKDKVPRMTFEEIIGSDSGVCEWRELLRKYGVVFMTDLPKERGQLSLLAGRVAGYIRATISGQVKLRLPARTNGHFKNRNGFGSEKNLERNERVLSRDHWKRKIGHWKWVFLRIWAIMRGNIFLRRTRRPQPDVNHWQCWRHAAVLFHNSFFH